MNGLQHTSTDSVFALSPPATNGAAGTANASTTTEHSRERLDSHKGVEGISLEQNNSDPKLDFENFFNSINIDNVEEIDISATNKISTQEVTLPDNISSDFLTNIFEQAKIPGQLKAELTSQHHTVPNPAQIEPKNTYPETVVQSDPLLNLSQQGLVDIAQPDIAEPTKVAPSASPAVIGTELVIDQAKAAQVSTLAVTETSPRINSQDVKVDSQSQNVPTLTETPPADTRTGQHDSQNQNSRHNTPNPAPQVQTSPANETFVNVQTLTPDTSNSFIARAPEIASITSITQASTPSTLQTNIQTSHVAIQQVGDALVRQAEKAGDIIVRLDPAELGRVNINFSFDKGNGVTAHVVADTASTAAVLRDRADILTLQLKQAGFENINLSFDTASDKQNNEGFGNQFSRQQSSQQAANQSAKFFDIVAQDKPENLDQTGLAPPQRIQADGIIDMKL